MLAAICALFGLIVGSFLNVVILRYPERGLGGRSACPWCGRTLTWVDLVPVFSWLALRGKCRTCKAPISIQYPLVEASTAVLFGAIGGAGLWPAPLLLALIIAALLVCIFVYDLYHQLIPDAWAYPFCALAFVFGLAVSYQPAPLTACCSSGPSAISFLVAGPLAALPILFLWYISRPFTGEAGQWMGFGDVKLALGIGFLLGFPWGFIAIFLAFIIGAAVSVFILMPLPHLLRFCGLRPKGADDGYTMKSEVPFGPFLIASCLIMWFVGMYHVSIPLLYF